MLGSRWLLGAMLSGLKTQQSLTTTRLFWWEKDATFFSFSPIPSPSLSLLGAHKLLGENLKVVLAKFSTLS
jgi:hypothetical protein